MIYTLVHSDPVLQTLHLRYDFLTREYELKALDALTLEGVKEWFTRYLAPGSSQRCVEGDRWKRGGR